MTPQTSKPIFVMRFPSRMKTQEVQHYFEFLTKKLNDYHVLFIRETSTPKVDIEVFNSIDVPAADIEKLKEEVRDSIKKL